MPNGRACRLDICASTTPAGVHSRCNLDHPPRPCARVAPVAGAAAEWPAPSTMARGCRAMRASPWLGPKQFPPAFPMYSSRRVGDGLEGFHAPQTRCPRPACVPWQHAALLLGRRSNCHLTGTRREPLAAACGGRGRGKASAVTRWGALWGRSGGCRRDRYGGRMHVHSTSSTTAAAAAIQTIYAGARR